MINGGVKKESVSFSRIVRFVCCVYLFQVFAGGDGGKCVGDVWSAINS
jgi:hypothetical protein